MTTNAPIEPRHKDEAAKAAEYEDWISVEVSNHPVAIAARASILAHAQTLANLEKARADLAEIDRIAVAGGFAQCLPGDPCLEIAAIAAPYRASDPVAEALKAEAIDTGWDKTLRGPRMSEATGKVIFKYQMPVLERFTMKLPAGAQIIRMEDQDGLFWLWAVVDTNAPLEDREFMAFKTGAKIPTDASLSYIGFCAVFVQMELGLYIFEVLP